MHDRLVGRKVEVTDTAVAPDLFIGGWQLDGGELLDVTLGWFFKLFNGAFGAATSAYTFAVGGLLRVSVIVLLVFGGLLALTYWEFTEVPTGFVPLEDRGMVMIDVWMPDAASQERTLAAVAKVETILSQTEGVRNYTSLPGFSMINGNGSNYALFFIGLEDWDERLPKGRDLNTILTDLEPFGDDVPDHLAEAGRLRIDHRQASLEELGALADPPMTKDAIAGRIRRLLATADKKAQDLGIPGTDANLTPDMLAP